MKRSMRFLSAPFFFVVLFICCVPTHAAQPETIRKRPASATIAKKVVKQAPAVSSSTQTKVTKAKASKDKLYKMASSSKVATSKQSYPLKMRYSMSLPSPRDKLDTQFVHPVSSPQDQGMESAVLSQLSASQVFIPKFPSFNSSYRGKVAAITKDKQFVQFSIDPDLQEFAKQIADKITSPHMAIVAMEPKTGRILAMAGRSISLPNILTHAGFPAASLIKVITASAAIEHGGARPDQEIFFRGGMYELGPNNYDPKPQDRLGMTIMEALGRSCNPVFSRVGLTYLNPALLRSQIAAFGFNSDLKLQTPVGISSATVPNENYEFGRTSAGFGEVFLSPIHAATLISTIANNGKMPQPSLIDQVISADGELLFRMNPAILRQAITPQTARTLLHMMTATTTIGTSRKEFAGKVPWEVAAKTGTLKGTNPVGLNNWFIGTAPLENPRIAVAVVVVNPNNPSSKASHIGKLILERYLG